MAKRRKLTAPTAADLSKIEAEFRSETRAPSTLAPIAQVAADTAESVEVLGTETRAKLAQADAFEEANAKGLVMADLPIQKIQTKDLFRDRMALDEDDMEELCASISKNGLRLPIEVYELDEPQGNMIYGLISGFRRHKAVGRLLMREGPERWKTIKGIIHPKASTAARFAAVVEENEVRADLSHFERGRYAALTAREGVFAGVEDAVDQLFPHASKAKRSKVRSFARIFEELGDLLTFPLALSERQGLRVSATLRDGAGEALRDALDADIPPQDAAQEWALLEPIVEKIEARTRRTSKTGRPKIVKRVPKSEGFTTASGVNVSFARRAKGSYQLSLKGAPLDQSRMQKLAEQIGLWLDEAAD